jgi:transposase-like protein
MAEDTRGLPPALKDAMEEAGAAGLFNKVQHQKKRAYLLAFSICGNVTLAAKAAGVDRSMVYKWRNGVAGRPNDHGDEAFRTAETIAKEMAADRLEEEAWRRAVDGVDEPVGFYRGEPGAWVKRYSDTLLIFLLKGLRPEKYRERYEHSGGDKPIPVMVVRRETASESTS